MSQDSEAATVLSDTADVRLAWVMVADTPRRVSDFAHLRPGQRPAATCPACGRAVVLKLGLHVAHHAAHHPGDLCATSAGETALHLNAKLHLAAELRRIAVLRVVERCAGAVFDDVKGRYVGCPETRGREWRRDWDQVEVERSVGSRRPDLLLLAAGQPLGAIEVLVSHAVDPDKAAELGRLGVSWLEVRASLALYAGPQAWSARDALPVEREAPASVWRCATHEAEHAAAEHRRNNCTRAWYARIVDLYYPSGRNYRSVYTIQVRIVAGHVVAVWLERDGGPVLAEADRPERAHAKAVLLAAFRRHVAGLEARGIIVDSPMPWQLADRLILTSNLVVYSDAYYPRRYRWDERRGRWFVPRALEAVRWQSTTPSPRAVAEALTLYAGGHQR